MVLHVMLTLYLACKTNYTHEYSVHGGTRYYYAGTPDVFQVGEHQFVEKALVESWVDMMLYAWCVAVLILARNCVEHNSPLLGPLPPIVHEFIIPRWLGLLL